MQTFFTSMIIVASTLWTAHGWAFNEPDEFMGVKWGTLCEDARSAIETRLIDKSKQEAFGVKLDFLAPSKNGNLGRGCSSSSYLGPNRHNLTFQDTIGDALVGAIMKFLDKKFEAVELKFKPHSYRGLSEAFLAKYGEPDSVRDSVVKNRLGTEFQNQTIVWAGKQVRIVMRKLATKIDESDVHITTHRWRESSAELQKDTRDKAVKDF